jgi:hypothetical protein
MAELEVGVSFAGYWHDREELFPQPQRFRGLRTMDFAEFRDGITSASRAFALAMVRSLHSGEAWVIRGAFPKEFMQELRSKTVAWTRSRPASFHKMLEGSPDFHRVIDLETGRNYSIAGCKHSAYFYRWNDDPLGIWPAITERWRLMKVLMGLGAEDYETFTPKDGVVDRIQVVRYPPAIGYLEPHQDPHLHQRLFFSGYMSKRGVDYEGGGFYFVGKNEEAVEVEDQFEVGDVCVGYATVMHGVAPCDRHKTPDWNADDGRWFLSMYSNASDEVEKRHTAHPVKVSIPGVLP